MTITTVNTLPLPPQLALALAGLTVVCLLFARPLAWAIPIIRRDLKGRGKK